MGTRYTYSQWDGTQSPFEELDTAFDRLSAEILEAGDVNEALRNLYAEIMERMTEEGIFPRPLYSID